MTKRNLLGVGVDATSYDEVVNDVFSAVYAQRSLTVTALAVHGVMTGVLDRTHRFRLNAIDRVVPDGQPVRWALNLIHGAGLRDRVYGPTLMLRVLARAEAERLSVFFYGSTPEVLKLLCAKTMARFPALSIAGSRPSRFTRVGADEQSAIVAAIRQSGARIVFVGLGCPRQEVWIFENSKALALPTLAVGAAFDFHAGKMAQAPAWMQKTGLEWAFRLRQEPKRLWRRYLALNPLYLTLVLLQAAGLRRVETSDVDAPRTMLHYA